MDNTEADIDIFGKAVEKFNKCDHSEQFFGEKACKLFFNRFDNSMDILAMCGSCRVNTSDPTTHNKFARFK